MAKSDGRTGFVARTAVFVTGFYVDAKLSASQGFCGTFVCTDPFIAALVAWANEIALATMTKIRLGIHTCAAASQPPRATNAYPAFAAFVGCTSLPTRTTMQRVGLEVDAPTQAHFGGCSGTSRHTACVGAKLTAIAGFFAGTAGLLIGAQIDALSVAVGQTLCALTKTFDTSLTRCTGFSTSAAMLCVVLFIDASPQTNRRCGFRASRNTHTFGTKLSAVAGFTACSAVLTVGLEIGACVVASGQTRRTSQFAASLLASFAFTAGCSASSAMLRVGLWVDASSCTGEFGGIASRGSFAQTLDAGFTRFAGFVACTAVGAAFGGIYARCAAACFACSTNTHTVLTDVSARFAIAVLFAWACFCGASRKQQPKPHPPYHAR